MKTLNQQIKDDAFEWKVDYKPWCDEMPPQDYAEYGYIAGASMMAEQNNLHPLKFWCVKVSNDEGESKHYHVPATSARDAQLMAFILDRGISDETINRGILHRGHVELAREWTEIVDFIKYGA